jgi:hypothetical protein
LRHWLAPSLRRPYRRDGVPSPYPWSSLVVGGAVPVPAPPQTWYSETPLPPHVVFGGEAVFSEAKLHRGAPPDVLCKRRSSSGERTRAISEAPSHPSQRIGKSTPPGRAPISPPFSGTGPEEPQSGQLRPFSRAIRVRRRFSRSVSHALLATLPVYLTPAHRRLLLPLFTGVRGVTVLRTSP